MDRIEKIQLYGNAVNQEYDNFSKRQKDLYYQAIQGLDCFPRKKRNSMSFGEKLTIHNMHRKASIVLSRHRQVSLCEKANSFLEKLFSRSPITKVFTSVSGYDDMIDPDFSKTSLELNKLEIAKILVSNNVLPNNFLNMR